MNTIKIENKSTRMIAHRGLSGLESENTCSAFVAAANRSYFGIETDVHRTADGKYIIIHDDTTARVCDRELPVEGSTLDELRSLRVKNKNGLVDRGDLILPLLSEYCAICKRYNKAAILELKNLMDKTSIGEIIDIVREHGDLNNTVFISFAFDNLVYIREFLPEQNCQFLVCDWNADIKANILKYNFDLDIYFGTLTKEIVSECHDAGIVVNCWTVDAKEDGERLVDYGVDYITSNILE